MNTVVAAGVGAVVAAGLVYVVMKSDRPAEPLPQGAPMGQSAPVVQQPEPLAVEPELKPDPVESPRRYREPDREPARSNTRPQTSPPTSVARNTPTNPPQQPQVTPTAAPTASVTPPPTPTAPVVEPPRVIEEKKPVRVAQTVTIPAGTMVSVRIDQSLSTKTNQTGDSFPASLDQPIVIDGFVIAERGAKVEGRIVESDAGGRVQGLAKLSLELVRLNSADGQRLRLQTEPFAKQAAKETKRDAMKVGAAAGIGAAIGAIAGGGKGAAIGAGVGGAAGAGGVAATRGASADIPAETRMTFRLRDAITVTEKLP